MKKIGIVLCGMTLAAGMALAAQQKSAAKTSTFYGNISDSMCGLQHSMAGSARECTESCVKDGAKYVLADEKNQKVYQLSDQTKPAPFAGEDVKVTGTLKGDTIEVASIEAAKN